MSLLDDLSGIPYCPRLFWDYVEGQPAPNNYCVLSDVGIYHEILVWEEDDSHYRHRIKGGGMNYDRNNNR